MLTNIEYKFRTLQEINDLILKFNHFSLIETVIMLLSIILVVTLILFIIPIINIYLNIRKINKIEKNKKIALKQILIQKEIEENIQKTIE